LKNLTADEAFSFAVIDQCQYGAHDVSNGLPVKKATSFLHGGMVFNQLTQKCTGATCCEGHSAQEGCIPGTSVNRTAVAAVFPWPLVAALVHDISDRIGIAQRQQQWYTHLWSCERCCHGAHKKLPDGTSTPTPPHTRTKGCRLNPTRIVVIPPGGVP
jgi:hypothetical protein